MSRFSFTSEFSRSTVVKTTVGFLEVRRGSITWTASFRAENPEVKQQIWPTLADWHKSLPTVSSAVEKWLETYTVPSADPTAPTYRLGKQLSYVMGGMKRATEEQLSDAIMDLSANDPDLPYLRFLLDDPFLAISEGDILGALESQGHILEEVAVEAVTPVMEMTKPVLLRPMDLLPLASAPAPAKIEFIAGDFKEKEKPILPAAPSDPIFAEIDALFFKVDAALVDSANSPLYKRLLIEQFIAFCLRPVFADAWRSNAFERIQMRASLMTWMDFTFAGDDYRAAAAIERFLATYPV
jgi:hypothetical protein